MTTTPPPQANIAEFAAQQVEKMPTYLSVDAIANIIDECSPGPTLEAQAAAQKIIEGIQPLFQAVADHIRNQPLSEIQEILTLRDQFVHERALDLFKAQAFEKVKNPVKKPRKVFDPLARKSIWYEDIVKIIDSLRVAPTRYEEMVSSVYQTGFKEAARVIAERVRNLRATHDPGDGVRVRQPADYADFIEKQKP